MAAGAAHIVPATVALPAGPRPVNSRRRENSSSMAATDEVSDEVRSCLDRGESIDRAYEFFFRNIFQSRCASQTIDEQVAGSFYWRISISVDRRRADRNPPNSRLRDQVHRQTGEGMHHLSSRWTISKR